LSDTRTVAAALDGKTKAGLSKSVVSHLRWELSVVFKLAADNGLIQGDPTGSLVTSKEAKTFDQRMPVGIFTSRYGPPSAHTYSRQAVADLQRAISKSRTNVSRLHFPRLIAVSALRRRT
jgi:hypothetical protein